MKIISEENSQAISIATNFLREGKVICFATDTVYGIAVDASNFKAVDKLYAVKNRDKNKPIAIFLPNLQMAEKIFIFDETAKKVVEKIGQKSFTLILKKRSESSIKLAENLNKNDEFLGFRVVKKDFIDNLLKSFCGVLAVTSANISGHSPAIEANQVKNNFDLTTNAIDLLIDGGECDKKVPSAVIKIDDGEIIILRKTEDIF